MSFANKSRAMTETPPTPTPSPPATNTPPRRRLGDIAVGGGDYLKAEMVPPRGLETTVIGTSWELNYAKDAEIPCLLLAVGDTEVKFKVTTKANATALMVAGVNEELGGAEGLSLYLQATQIRGRDGTSKVSIQIAEVTSPEGKRLFPA